MFSVTSILVCAFVFIGIVTARPGNDVQIVESTIREVRAIAPDDLISAGKFLFKKNHRICYKLFCSIFHNQFNYIFLNISTFRPYKKCT